MEEDKKERIYKVIMIVAIAMFITFIATSISLYTFFVENPVSVKTSNSIGTKSLASTLQSYRNIIDKYYLGDINEKALEEGAIAGYIDGLGDPYTEYISKEDMKDYLEDTMGNFVGIGIYMVKNTEYNKIQVLSTIKNGPAENAGMRSGDLILAVDGVNYTGDEMTQASNNIKGEEGTNVTVEILRGDEQISFNLTRKTVKVNQVEGEVISDGIGYIKFSSFDETTAGDFKNKFNELNNQGISSLIIDLRNNGGGIVDQALKIADYVVDKDTVLLYEVDKNNNELIKKSTEDKIIDMPIIILTNKNSASASEILVGALKDLKKAKTVGTTTYGKGIIQQILSLTDGSGLKITTEEYLTPNRNKIHNIGITPDVEIEMSEEDVKNGVDTQLQKAIEMLK